MNINWISLAYCTLGLVIGYDVIVQNITKVQRFEFSKNSFKSTSNSKFKTELPGSKFEI